MKSLVLWGIVFVLAVGGAYLAGSRQKSKSPPGWPVERSYVGFEPRSLDLGDHLWDTLLPLELTFVNDGPDPIVIGSITSTCDCVLFEGETYQGHLVQSGEVLAVPLALHTGRYPGLKQRMVKLVGASGRQYTAELFVRVRGTWSLEPDLLDFGEVPLGDPNYGDPERTLTFVSGTDELVGNPEVNVGWLRCFTADRDAETTDILVRVVKEELGPGVSTANIVFRTTSSVRPNTAVYVRVKAVPALVATTTHVCFVGAETKRVRFADRDGRPARLARVEASSEDIRATIVSDDELEFSKAREQISGTPVTVRVEDVKGRFTIVTVSAY